MYDTKQQYRTYFNNLKKVVKLGILADKYGCPRSTLSLFLKSDAYDMQLSLNRLEYLRENFVDEISKMI